MALLLGATAAHVPAWAHADAGLSSSREGAVGEAPPQEHEPRSLSYDEAVQIALRENVDLLAIREQESALKAQSKQAMGPNEPVFTWNKNDIPTLSLTETPAQTYYQVSWILGFPGKALSQSASLRYQAEAASEQARTQEITLMTALSNSYVGFAINDAFHKFLLDEQKSDKDLIQLIKKRYAASQATKVDLLNAEVTTQQIAQAILENRNDYEVQLTQFRQVIRRPSETWLMPRVPDRFVIPTVTRSFDELLPVMLRNNRAIASAQKQADAAGALVTGSELQALPDLQLSTGINDWRPASAPNQGIPRDYTIAIGFAVPIFFPFNELEGIHAAQHNRGAAEYQLDSQRLQAVAALQTAYTSLKAALKDLDASERLVVPAAKASYDLTVTSYGYGKADYLMLAAGRKAWHDAERDMLTKRQNAANLYTQLIALMGCDIQQTEGFYACK